MSGSEAWFRCTTLCLYTGEDSTYIHAEEWPVSVHKHLFGKKALESTTSQAASVWPVTEMV